MAEEKYSTNESLDRIYRLLRGDTVSEAPESLTPPLHSEDESLSLIAELLAGTLEGVQAVLPMGMDSYGMMYNRASLTTGTYLSSGTWVVVSMPTGTSFLNVTESHIGVTDSLTVSKAGKYLVGYDVNFAGTKDAEYEFCLYVNAALPDYGYNYLTLRASGTYHSIGATQIVNEVANYTNSLIVRSSTHNANFAVKDARFWVKSL